MIDLVRLSNTFDDTLATLVRYQDALAHYARKAGWEHVLTDEGYVTGPAIDGGERARAALADAS